MGTWAKKLEGTSDGISVYSRHLLGRGKFPLPTKKLTLLPQTATKLCAIVNWLNFSKVSCNRLVTYALGAFSHYRLVTQFVIMYLVHCPGSGPTGGAYALPETPYSHLGAYF